MSLKVLTIHIYFSLQNVLKSIDEMKDLRKILRLFACFSVCAFTHQSVPVVRLPICSIVRLSGVYSEADHGFSDFLPEFRVSSISKTDRAWVLENNLVFGFLSQKGSKWKQNEFFQVLWIFNRLNFSDFGIKLQRDEFLKLTIDFS